MIARLARENATRNPSRTAVSASSLMIGLALVIFVTIYASGLRASTRRVIHQTFLGMITTAIGSLLGVCLGVFLAWVITRALVGEGIIFTLPWLQVGAVLAVGLLVGLIAALVPARRAAGIDVLAAIAHE